MDTNIILSSVLGVKTTSLLSRVANDRQLIASAISEAEARAVVRKLRGSNSSEAGLLENVFAELELVSSNRLKSLMTDAAKVLQNGPASKNGSTDDAHILATAWLYEADIWSHDRDFCGIGWPVWSSANLLAAVEEVN